MEDLKVRVTKMCDTKHMAVKVSINVCGSTSCPGGQGIQ